MFAFTGNLSALMVSSLSALFVCAVSVLIKPVLKASSYWVKLFSLICITLLAGCGEGQQSELKSVLDDIALSSGAISNSELSNPELSNSAKCSPFAETEAVTISHIHDGDTLTLSDGRKVRLIGVNATEVAKKGSLNQPFSLKAKQAVQAFIAQSKRVQLLTDVESKDHYGRWLGHIYNGAGDNLEQFLLKQGLAYHVAIPPNLSLVKCLDQAEQQAQDKQLGLWSVQGIPAVMAKLVKQGGFQRVQGKVTSVRTGKHWHLKLDNDFTVMLYSEHQHRFTKSWFKQLQGKTIEVQGWVYSSKGPQSKDNWRMKLETPYGVELL